MTTAVATQAHALTSPLPGVSDVAWRSFVRAVVTKDADEDGAPGLRSLDAKSKSGGFGCFDIRPKRLLDLGIMRNLRRSTSSGGRQIYVGDFVPPMSERKFLYGPTQQSDTFVESMRRYDVAVSDADRPEGLSRSGVLALLHRAGMGGLSGWASGRRLANTVALVERANNLF